MHRGGALAQREPRDLPRQVGDRQAGQGRRRGRAGALPVGRAGGGGAGGGAAAAGPEVARGVEEVGSLSGRPRTWNDSARVCLAPSLRGAVLTPIPPTYRASELR